MAKSSLIDAAHCAIGLVPRRAVYISRRPVLTDKGNPISIAYKILAEGQEVWRERCHRLR